MSRQSIFADIWRSNSWGCAESRSGPGSTKAVTAGLRSLLKATFEFLDIKILVDAGCGDLNWMEELTPDLRFYFGYDIVPELIADLRTRFGNRTNCFFNAIDVVMNTLPESDAILCRDCLTHLPQGDALIALKRFRQSGTRYLIATTHAGGSNKLIGDGGWYRIDLTAPPFSLPVPRCVLDEGEGGGKMLGVWSANDLPQFDESPGPLHVSLIGSVMPKLKQNKFIFIIPFRNVSAFIQECALSVIGQQYKNWTAYFLDDASTDGTVEKIPQDPRFHIISNRERITALPNIHFGIMNADLDDEDIICILDGDDYLSRPDAINILNDLYQDDTLLTFGSFSYHNNGAVLHHYCTHYTREEFQRLRTYGFRTTHIKTFKYKLYREIFNQDPDLECYRDSKGDFYTSACDVAFMFPMLEIAGFDRIKCNHESVYYYRLHPQNDHVVNPFLQAAVASEIVAKKSFKTIG